MMFTQTILTMVLLGNTAAAWVAPFVALLGGAKPPAVRLAKG